MSADIVRDCETCGVTFTQPRRRGRYFRKCENCRNPRRLPRSAGDHDPGNGLEYLRRLPEEIARHAERGSPVVVELPANLSPAHQGLMAALGVLVRFKAKP